MAPQPKTQRASLLQPQPLGSRCCKDALDPLEIRGDANPLGEDRAEGLDAGISPISALKLTAPPEFGKVTLQGPGFSYTAKTDFEGQDAFTIQVSGTMVRMTGTSDIQVTVSVAK